MHATFECNQSRQRRFDSRAAVSAVLFPHGRGLLRRHAGWRIPRIQGVAKFIIHRAILAFWQTILSSGTRGCVSTGGVVDEARGMTRAVVSPATPPLASASSSFSASTHHLRCTPSRIWQMGSDGKHWAKTETLDRQNLKPFASAAKQRGTLSRISGVPPTRGIGKL